MAKYQVTNVEILAYLIFLEPGRRASVYRKELYQSRNGRGTWGTSTRGWYTQYFRDAFDAWGCKTNNYVDALWCKDTSTGGWHLTNEGVQKVRDLLRRNPFFPARLVGTKFPAGYVTIK